LLILFMLLMIGTFAINFPIFISTMAVSVFHAGAGQFGLLSSMMAIGSVAGALLAARRETPTMTIIMLGAAAMGVGLTLAALAPHYLPFGFTLIIVGLAAQTLTTSSIGKVQLTTAPVMRGRVMAILMAVTLGTTPIGAPIVGWVADAFGPRWAIGVGAAACFIAATVAFFFMSRKRAEPSAEGAKTA
jgi:MFS family permease